MIENVETYILRANIQEPFGFSQGWYTQRSAMVVKITTDDGLSGWGECYGPPEATSAIIDKLYAQNLIGKDPLDKGVLWEYLYNRFRDYGQKGFAIAALSGIDIALWDLTGKILHQPIFKIIGGAERKKVMAYATGLYFTKKENAIELLVNEALDYVSRGFKAIKMKIGLGIRKDIERVAAVREAIGEDVMLMVDANHAYNASGAISTANKIERYDIGWFEEPVPPEDIDGYINVRNRSPIPIAGGECEYTRYGFRDLISRRGVDIVQPDICSMGGISEVLRVISMCSAFGLQCNPHVWGSSIALAAAIQVLSSMPYVPPSIVPQEPMLEFDRTENPFREHLAEKPIEQKDGYVSVPSGYGLGVEINEDMIRRYRV